MTNYRKIATLNCGCDLMAINNESYVHKNGPCVYHDCRLCGHIVLADSEPDRLCYWCYEDKK